MTFVKYLCLIFFCWTLEVHGLVAQYSKWSAVVTLGTVIPLLDSGVGFQLGVQPHYAIWRYLGVEGLLNFSRTNISGNFISGTKSNEMVINSMLGARLYLNAPEKRNRFFVNMLLGQSFYREQFRNGEDRSFREWGLSTGLYFQPSRYILGLGMESPGYLFIKAGMKF